MLSEMEDDELWRLAHEAAGTDCLDFDVSSIPEILSVVLTVELVQGIIDNGGVELLIGPELPQGLKYSDCSRAFKLIESWLCAQVLDDVLGAFPDGMPSESPQARAASLDWLLDTKRELFEQASQAFWDSSALNYAAALRLLRANPEVLNVEA